MSKNTVMEKIFDIFTLKYTTARPMGYVRFTLFLLTFLIARIPLWFVILCAFLLNHTIGVTQVIFISFAGIICRIFIDSEITGGSRSFLYFLGIHTLRGMGALLFYFAVFGIITYIIAPHSDVFGKISMALVIVLLYLFMADENKNTYWQGYHMPLQFSAAVSFLWLYLAFIPDKLFVDVLVVIVIYILEFYNLLFKEPLGMLPNRQTLKKQ